MNYGREEHYEDTRATRSLIPPSEAPPPYSVAANQQDVGVSNNTLGFVIQHQQQAFIDIPVNVNPRGTREGHLLDNNVPAHEPTRTDFFIHEEVKVQLSLPEGEDPTISNCCDMCCVESLNCGVKQECDAMTRSFAIGGRGLFYSFLSNNPSYWGLKIFAQLSICLAALVLFVLNLTILGLLLTSSKGQKSSTITALLAVNVALPFLLLVYSLIDIIICIRFVQKKNRINNLYGVTHLYTINSAYKANFARLIIPELILYPLVLTSFFTPLFINSSLFGTHNDTTLVYPLGISFILSCVLFILMVVVYRLYIYVCLGYSVRATTHGTLPKNSLGIPAVLGLFIYHSFGFTVLQILIMVCTAIRGYNDIYSFDWSVWYYMAYGCVCHMFGMMAVVFINYRLIRGLSIELFIRICSRIYHSIVLFPDVNQQLTQFYAVLDRVRPNSGYPTPGDAMVHPFKNGLALVTTTLFGTASVCILINIALFDSDVLGYVIIGVLCLVNVQVFLITLVVAAVLALCVLLVALFLFFLRFGSWRLCFLLADNNQRQVRRY